MEEAHGIRIATMFAAYSDGEIWTISVRKASNSLAVATNGTMISVR